MPHTLATPTVMCYTLQSKLMETSYESFKALCKHSKTAKIVKTQTSPMVIVRVSTSEEGTHGTTLKIKKNFDSYRLIGVDDHAWEHVRYVCKKLNA